MPSARVKPVTMITAPAIAVAMNAIRSVRMCWNEPSIFSDSRFALDSCQVAARFTATPTMATTRIGNPAGFGGETSRLIPS